MSKLYENPLVVDQLNRILETNYPFLEYSEMMSKRLSTPISEALPMSVKDSYDVLHVKVKSGHEQEVRNRQVIQDICDKLSKATGITFYTQDSDLSLPGQFYNGADYKREPNINTEWYAFALRKR
ncbi:MAG: hypothetical protein OXI24_12275 [Candidatus Poribacteria bacterium]|nr:hypothetical protein [Candidatus Poribacteria bacterium]